VAAPEGANVRRSVITWLAWSSLALTVLALAIKLFLTFLDDPSASLSTTLEVLLILSFSTVGVLVSSHRPGNAIGWLFCSGALIWALGEFSLQYGVHLLAAEAGTSSVVDWATWFGGWARGLGWFLIVSFLLLLFPDGRLPSPRWRPVLWGSAGYVAFFTLAIWLSPVSNDFRLMQADNPLGLDLRSMSLFSEIANLTSPLVLLAGGLAVIFRFRASVGEERQQLKWFAYAVFVMVVLFTSWFLLGVMGLTKIGSLLFIVPLLGLPVAVGIAILKYRLYDIDRIINRTLVYGVLTVLLALVYFGAVAGLQRLLSGLVGSGSQLAIVASTLTIAALFSPLRSGIQSFIDRRFYRKKYDAAKTLEEFGARLRDETDLETLSDNLVTVARETVQPAHISLWLREPRERR